jgi:two-component system sensor histidine kinase/response regulator
MGVPLIAGDMVEGSMCIQNFHNDNCYDQSDLTLLATLGTQVALAIRNARLYRQAAEARAEAEEANRTKSRFLANVSHELRTPLNAIINFSWILGQEIPALTTDHRNLLERIGQSGHYLLGLINGILDLAKIEAGHMDLTLERIDLAALVADSLRMVEGLLTGRPLSLRVDLPAGLPEVQADRARLSQVLLNLLSNSIKFTAQGTITVSAEAAGAFLTVHVADSGTGIDPADLNRIFSEFVQLNPDADPRLRGTGLGLPISARLVQLMGGRLWADSVKGRGSVFSFTLPIAGGQAS